MPWSNYRYNKSNEIKICLRNKSILNVKYAWKTCSYCSQTTWLVLLSPIALVYGDYLSNEHAISLKVSGSKWKINLPVTCTLFTFPLAVKMSWQNFTYSLRSTHDKNFVNPSFGVVITSEVWLPNRIIKELTEGCSLRKDEIEGWHMIDSRVQISTCLTKRFPSHNLQGWMILVRKTYFKSRFRSKQYSVQLRNYTNPVSIRISTLTIKTDISSKQKQ